VLRQGSTVTGAIVNVDIRRLRAADKWANGPAPQRTDDHGSNCYQRWEPFGTVNMVVSIEQHVDWVGLPAHMASSVGHSGAHDGG
jgi:hypothetical protein